MNTQLRWARIGRILVVLGVLLAFAPRVRADFIKFTVGSSADDVAGADGKIQASAGFVTSTVMVMQGETAGMVTFRLWQAMGGDINGNMITINSTRTGSLATTGAMFPGGITKKILVTKSIAPPDPGQPPQPPPPIPNVPFVPNGASANVLVAPGGVLGLAGTLTKTITTDGGTMNVLVPFAAGSLISDVHTMVFTQMMAQSAMLPAGVTVGRLPDGTPSLFGLEDFSSEFFDQMTLAGGGTIPDSFFGSYSHQAPGPGGMAVAAAGLVVMTLRRRV